MSRTPLFDRLPKRCSILELLSEELSNTIFRIIKRPPRPRASYEAGMAALFHEFKVQIRISPSNIPNLFENYRWQHRIVDST
jgi:hypothetical protein